jgi:four helix bundle protein
LKGGNDPEVIMTDPVQPRLIAHRKALDAAGLAIQLALTVPAPLKSVADQIVRSATSVPANIAEGHGRTGRDRRHHWRIAYASAKEVDGHLRLLQITGSVAISKAEHARQLFDEVRAMTWRLLHPGE